MGKTSLWHGILAACFLSAVSGPLLLGLQWLGGGSAMFIVVLGLSYLAYLLAISPSRRGRFVLGLGSAVILLGAWIVSPVSVVVGALVVGLIWLVRSVLFYAGILPALWDGGLCALSAVCALGTAVSTHRLWLAVWVFFLLQALFVCIPQRFARGQRGPGSDRGQAESASQSEAFTRAHRAAEEALQAMAQRL
jgi:MFS family permease